MADRVTRRCFLHRAAAAGTTATFVAVHVNGMTDKGRDGGKAVPDKPAGDLVLNDDGHVFLYLNDDLGTDDLRHYLKSYCRGDVSTVAYCVGDMTWPTLHPTEVGVHYSKVRKGAPLKRSRMYRNVDNFADEPGGYFGTVFRTIHELGRKVLASFRMNDAHFTSTKNTHVSEFWKKHVDLALGREHYGYYGGCLNYASDVVREHFLARVKEFVALYPDVDGVELDAMRSPFFFPPGEGEKNAPLFTGLVREVKAVLREQAARLGRSPYRLEVNVPVSPELALESGLDVATWDAEQLFDRISVGPYQAYMNHPMDQWKKVLKRGTPVYPYIGCSPQSGQYLGLEEYRAAAANAYASGADGIYLFNYPCLFELSSQVPRDPEDAGIELVDMSPYRQLDLSQVAQSLDEMGHPERLRHKNKRFLFYWSNDTRHRHYDPDVVSLKRGSNDATLQAAFRCYEDYDRAKDLTLRLKVENVARTEQFNIAVNGRPIAAENLRVLYAANGRDARIHTIKLQPYLLYEIALDPSLMKQGENLLEVEPSRLLPWLRDTISLLEIELIARYA